MTTVGQALRSILEGGATFGLDCTYEIYLYLGLGPVVDYVTGDLEAFTLGAGLWIRPFCRLEDLSFYVAPGVDIAHEEEEDEHEDTERSWKTKALLRLGATYGFDLGRGFRLAPSFYLDLIVPDEQVYVFGLTFAKEF